MADTLKHFKRPQAETIPGFKPPTEEEQKKK